jgi:uncharacterized membrane protein
MSVISKYTKHINTATIYAAPMVALLALGFVLNTTNPLQSGPLIILAVFVLIYIVVVSLFSAALHLIATVVRMVRPSSRFSMKRGYYVVSIIGLAPVLFIALNTLGQLDMLEIVLILLLFGLGCFYVVRRSSK